ncbi:MULTISPECIES: HNH endonuclease [Thermodesulfobacterium]|jgi:5-methylcytosine-specific restriction endonuclease McrA|uniref:HNH endonuclease n=2 Tax=Thermodesulfobacterium commune TaxID=1741 RepID=A0A075WYP0_9BACT|nr:MULTISPECIES: HNH endonuclease [Thermodesulfobacterium]KUJ97442.1 MAG: HNH endonuclease [Thermodesulfobacterium sp. 37_54]KUK18820.1 MAG: HNH endonuclease [Thermodesulfobacterium commune]AIH03762.1 HNH endonuclease [Thermodesulfobacterium commune DSM 2178]KUK37356.1 MAG: HNH endonuclease [Thermodesulfobacterium commune]MBZ4681668.1 endonuclease [Thermodesulfobacterium sp.]
MKKSLLNEKVLVLNKYYQAIQITTVQKAICHLVKGTAKVITSDWTTHTFEEWIKVSKFYENGAQLIKSPSISILIPEAIYLPFYERLPKTEVIFSRQNLFLRDGFTCQYCGKFLKNPKDRTIDHIIPKSRGGKTVWTNVVLCCKKCNLKKGNKTPEEAGLKLLKTPKPPKWQSLILEEFPKHKKEVWKVFLDFAGIIED